MQASVDPLLIAILVVIFLFIFAVYFFMRKTLLAFREGYEEDR